MRTPPPIRWWRKGCEEVSYSSIGSSGFIDSGVGGKVAMNCREAASPMPVPHTCGTTAVFHAWAMAAILHSVNPRRSRGRAGGCRGHLGDPAPKARLPEQVLPSSEVGVGEVPQRLVPL